MRAPGRRHTILAISILIVMTCIPLAVAQEDYTPVELLLTVYGDGYIGVDYGIDVDPTKARVNVALFGSHYQYLLIEDQDGLPLDSSPVPGGLNIDSLGSISMLISYVTPDLTGKVGPIWYLTVESPVNCSIILPEEAVYAPTGVELSLSIIDGSILLEMPAGVIDISYSLQSTNPREEALAVINNAEAAIQAINTKGVITTQADDLIQQAYSALDAEQYAQAEQLAGQALMVAQGAEAAALSAQGAIDVAAASISAARDAGRTVGLDQAEYLLEQAQGAYSGGNYPGAKSLAEQASASAAAATKEEEPEPEPKGNNTIWYILAFLVVAGGAGAYYFLYVKKKLPTQAEAQVKVDLDAIFQDNPYLRLDDKEVIRFVSEAGGSAFAAEIRDRFEVPRTSLWRMLRRLEREGIIEMQNVGGQSLVRISPKYSASRES
jgi:uncharacterized membrane protein